MTAQICAQIFWWFQVESPLKLLEVAYLLVKRQELSLQKKIEVLDKVKKQPPNSSQRELAAIFKIPRSTLTRLINKEEELRSCWCEVFCHGHKPAKKLKRLHKGKAPEVDTAPN